MEKFCNPQYLGISHTTWDGKYVEFLMFHDVPRGLHTTSVSQPRIGLT